MAASIFLAALALLFVAQPGLSRPDQSTPDVQQLLREVQTSVEKSIAEAKKSLNLPENPDGAAIVRAIREQSQNAEKTLQDMRSKLEESVKKNPELSEAIENLKKKISEAEADLKKEHPDVAENARKVADSLQNAYESVGKELSRLRGEINKKGGIADDLSQLVSSLYDRGTAAAKELSNKLDEAIKQAQKS